MEAVCSPLSLFREINYTTSISAPARMVSAAVPRVVCSTCVAVVKHNQRRTSRDNSAGTSTTRTKTGDYISWACFNLKFLFKNDVAAFFFSLRLCCRSSTNFNYWRWRRSAIYLSLYLLNLFSNIKLMIVWCFK